MTAIQTQHYYLLEVNVCIHLQNSTMQTWVWLCPSVMYLNTCTIFANESQIVSKFSISACICHNHSTLKYSHIMELFKPWPWVPDTNTCHTSTRLQTELWYQVSSNPDPIFLFGCSTSCTLLTSDSEPVLILCSNSCTHHLVHFLHIPITPDSWLCVFCLVYKPHSCMYLTSWILTCIPFYSIPHLTCLSYCTKCQLPNAEPLASLPLYAPLSEG